MPEASIPKGTRDFSPGQMRVRQHLIRTITSVYELFGFQPIETPAMENLTTLMGKYGDEGDKLLFKVLNSGDFLSDTNLKDPNLTSQSLLPQIASKGLRYDLTIPFARYVVQHRNDIQFPFRRYQIQPVWRADRPQKGRYREFWQCDADVIGTDSLVSELDLIQIYHRVFHDLGLPEYSLRLNHRKLLEAIAGHFGFGDTFKEFTVTIDKLDKIGVGGVNEELARLNPDFNPGQLHQFMQKMKLNRASIEMLRSSISPSPNLQKALDDLEFLIRGLELVNIPAGIELDLSLARGLDYYTGCIFEAVIEGSGVGSVSGGGRYDDLTGVFGLKDVSGVGISFGIDRLYDILVQRNLVNGNDASHVRVLICHFDEQTMLAGLELSVKLREANIPAELYPEVRKLKKQMDFANKCAIPFVALIGSDELEQQKVRLKIMASGEQLLLNTDELIQTLSDFAEARTN